MQRNGTTQKNPEPTANTTDKRTNPPTTARTQHKTKKTNKTKQPNTRNGETHEATDTQIGMDLERIANHQKTGPKFTDLARDRKARRMAERTKKRALLDLPG